MDLIGQLDQTQLHILHIQRFARALIKTAQGISGNSRLAGIACNPEIFTASRDGHIQRSLDLLQVLVQRTA